MVAGILYFVGYASIATISIPIVAVLLFAYRTWTVGSPWQYILYGVIAEVILVWTLRPNIRRLINGTERIVGLRARRRKSNSDYSSSSSSPSS
jgi:glycerol-3-phosphate acyltransferase PlsY